MKIKENYRIIAAVTYFDENDNKISLNAGEELPLVVLQNRELIQLLLDQERICRVDKNGENIISLKLDDLDREILQPAFVHGLSNPKRTDETIDFLKNHHISENNLELLKQKINQYINKYPKDHSLDPVLVLINEQLEEVKAAR